MQITDKIQKYNSAPLPFQGQKRSFVKSFINVISEFRHDCTFVDLFGGSGLLSHTTKFYKPKARVIWNDFDNYLNRLEIIPQTNILIAKLRDYLKDVPDKQRLSIDQKGGVLEIISHHIEEFGNIDFITISSNLLFSGNYVKTFEEFSKETLYCRVTSGQYRCDGYLQGVERESTDYMNLIDRYCNIPNMVLILDPPYLTTDVSSYNDVKYWDLKRYLNILDVIKGYPFIYFTSDKSSIVDVASWIDDRYQESDIFKSAKIAYTKNSVNHNSSYNDIMVYKTQGLGSQYELFTA